MKKTDNLITNAVLSPAFARNQQEDHTITPGLVVTELDEEWNKIEPLAVRQGMDVVVSDIVAQFENTGTIYGSSVRRVIRGMNNAEDDWTISPMARERLDKFEMSELAKRVSQLRKVDKPRKAEKPKED